MMLNPVMAKRHVKGMCDLMIDPIEAFVADLDDAAATASRSRWPAR